MKHLFSLFIVLTFVSCCKKENSIGAIRYRLIYYLVGNELIDAQNHSITFEKSGGNKTLYVVSPGNLFINFENKCDGINAVILDDITPYQWIHENRTVQGFVQPITITADINQSGHSKSAILLIDSCPDEFYEAKLSIQQTY